MNSFFDLLIQRRSIRKFLPTPVEAEKTAKILKAALMAPASKRRNPWEFIVIQDKQMLLALSETREYGSAFLSEAPTAIVVIADTGKSDIWIEDATIAATIIQLEAVDLGLGTCWIQIFGRLSINQEPAGSHVRRLLEIPSNYEVLSIIAMGYPSELRAPHDPDLLEFEKIHTEFFK